ncbi:MAG: CGNR zinc finger domain-containing protein [Xanthobacteraceae bacterium]
MSGDEAGDIRDGMPFVGGRLWIDLVNSAPRAFGDFLATPEGWARWAAAAGPAGAAFHVPPDGAEAEAARELRHALAGLFEDLSRERAPTQAAVDQLNHQLENVTVRRRIERRDGGLDVHEYLSGVQSPLAAVADDVADFIRAYEPARMRHCSEPSCTLVFYDTSRNGARRWCSMALCGNRHKVRNHRARKASFSCE